MFQELDQELIDITVKGNCRYCAVMAGSATTFVIRYHDCPSMNSEAKHFGHKSLEDFYFALIEEVVCS